MQIRHFISAAFILLVAALHFAGQWYAWKVHLFEIPVENELLAPPADYLWKVISWPMFYVVPRRTQHLHFLAVLLANSLTWGAAFIAMTTSTWRLAQRVRIRRMKRRAASMHKQSTVRTAPPSRAERIIELNSLLNRRRITEDEYRVMRRAIMREKEPQPDSVGPRLEPNKAVTYVVPRDANGAEHVAWLDEIPGGTARTRVAKREARNEQRTTIPPPPSAGRNR